MKRLFLSGPYNPGGGCCEYQVLKYITNAEKWSVRIRQAAQGRAAIFCPHKNSAHLGGAMPYDFWIAECFAFLAVCDACVMLPGWESSPGAQRERAFALAHGVRVFDTSEAGIAALLQFVAGETTP
jgi:hypothetical protein